MFARNCWAFILFGLLAGISRGDRITQSLDGEWLFTRNDDGKTDASGESFNTQNWKKVSVPHDWAIAGPFNAQGNPEEGKLPWRGVGWYRRTFTLPAKDHNIPRVFIEFDGVMALPQVWVNGKTVGGWDCGYTGFCVDVTPFVRWDKKPNVIAVRTDTRGLSGSGYPGAGIYRSVRLSIVPEVLVDAEQTFISTPDATRDVARVRIASTILNSSGTTSLADIQVLILDPTGREVEDYSIKAPMMPGHGKFQFVRDFFVERPTLWDIDAPALYTVRIAIVHSASPDTRDFRFGIRAAEFTPDDGFHLNGRRVPIKGVNLSSILGPLGMAFNLSAARRQLTTLKDMGANAIRTYQNPCAPELLDLCDEMGLMVLEECFEDWHNDSGKRRGQRLEDYVGHNLQAFARRDRNHPSVIAWSVGNASETSDIKHFGTGELIRNRYRAFYSALHETDGTRPIGITCMDTDLVREEIPGIFDFTCWGNRAGCCAVKAMNPDAPVLYAAAGAGLSSGGYYDLPLPAHQSDYSFVTREVSSYDLNSAENGDLPDLIFKRMEHDRSCSGGFMTCGFDRLGDPFPYAQGNGIFPVSALPRSSFRGVCDFIGIPKDRFYLYRSQWNTNAVTLHILPHWNWRGFEGNGVPVFVYTSGDSAELFLNGKSLGRQSKSSQAENINLALGKPVTCSTWERTAKMNNPPTSANDGNASTRWAASSDKLNEWWQVDFGTPIDIRSVKLTFELSPAWYGCLISVSDDNKRWRTVLTKQPDDTSTFFACNTKARYLRVTFNQLRRTAWASMYEVCVTDSGIEQPPAYDICKQYRLSWPSVPYEPGELKAVAYQNGRPIGETVMRTADDPVAVRLTPESPALPNDGRSLAFVQVDLVDAKGTRDPCAFNRVGFRVKGPGEIVAVGNGDPHGYDSFAATDSHPLYFGKALVLLRRLSPGEVTLTASVPGLREASATFK